MNRIWNFVLMFVFPETDMFVFLQITRKMHAPVLRVDTSPGVWHLNTRVQIHEIENKSANPQSSCRITFQKFKCEQQINPGGGNCVSQLKHETRGGSLVHYWSWYHLNTINRGWPWTYRSFLENNNSRCNQNAKEQWVGQASRNCG
jgi:hypothetical protein